MDRKLLESLLIKHEGIRYRPYLDLKGNITIGIGHNLTANGLYPEIVTQLFQLDIQNIVLTPLSNVEWYNNMGDEVRQAVICDMVFNMGLDDVLEFTHMIDAIQKKQWENASYFMLQSRWAKQVGNRAVELAEIMRTGKSYL